MLFKASSPQRVGYLLRTEGVELLGGFATVTHHRAVPTCASSGKVEWHGSASEFAHGLSILATSKLCVIGRMATPQPARCALSFTCLGQRKAYEVLTTVDGAFGLPAQV